MGMISAGEPVERRERERERERERPGRDEGR